MIQQTVDAVHNLSGVVVGDFACPAGPDTLGTIYKHQWNDGNVPLGLHLLVVVIEELQQVGIYCWEKQLRKRTVEKDHTGMLNK